MNGEENLIPIQDKEKKEGYSQLLAKARKLVLQKEKLWTIPSSMSYGVIDSPSSDDEEFSFLDVPSPIVRLE